MEVRFLSANKFKIQEASEILQSSDISVVPIMEKIEEIQTEDSLRLVRDKALKAFKTIGKPLFVEHTGLYIDFMNGLPGGLTQIFWDSLGADKFAELFGKASNNELTAKTIIAYVDGKQFHIFEGSIKGHVPSVPKGNRDFQWDCVFIPQGKKKTFAEMGKDKNKISMRRLALNKFANFLGGLR